MSLSYKTRTCLLPLLVNGKPFATQHHSRVSNFLASFSRSDNEHVAFIGERAKFNTHGALGRNFIRCEGDVDIVSPAVDLATRAHAIKELLDIRDGLSVLVGMSFEDVELFIENLCCY